RYLTQDALGSTRVVTDANMTVVARHDYFPFGEEIPPSLGGRAILGGYGTLDAIRQRFTGKERDTESGLDYFGARYFSAGQGRFTSPDEWTPIAGGSPSALPYADVLLPQSLNRYAYVMNNPLRSTDPDGHCAEALHCT